MLILIDLINYIVPLILGMQLVFGKRGAQVAFAV